ncbi:CHAT domain-containing tetratricopeptide repeat protein [uncultured Psychroserpens sp.]|uniref:CHAT domain-containing protein n=1 Tax=uncultured Psychroserpens sp. TaxID=255436 RepID=UPI002631D942|nr:CHAT domain-containing tetratricopeptide repeat protein [uncultured Psychroserpens sp.]
MFRKFYFAIVFLFCSGVLLAQNTQTPLEIYRALSETKDLDKFGKQKLLDSLVTKSKLDFDQNELAHTYYELLLAFYKTNVDLAINYAKKIRTIGETLNDTTNFYLKNDKNLVFLSYLKGAYSKSILHGKEFLKKHPSENVRQAVVYRFLGNSYNDLGDFKEAIAHYNKAIYIFKEYEELKEEGRTLINLLDVYVKLDDPKLQDDVFDIIVRFDDIGKVYEFDDEDILKKELNAGAFFDCIKDYDNAKKKYTRSLELSKTLSDSLNISKSLINLGIAYRKENNLEVAEEKLLSAMPYINDNHQKKASLYNNLADVYKESNNYEQALSYYNLAVSTLLQIENRSVFDVPDIKSLNAVDNKVDLLGYLIDKANMLLLINDNEFQTKYLELALNIYGLSDQIADIIYFESREDFSKLFWREEASNFYLNATEAAYLLNKPKEAFYYIEKSKAILLLENITTSKAKALVNLPEHLINREYDLINGIKKAEDNLFSLKKTAQNILTDSLQNIVFSRKQDYTRFIDSLEIAYPSYHRFKKNITVYDSKMVRESLKKNEIVLQYKLSKDKGFVVLITQSSEAVFRLNNISKIHNLLNQYSHLISKPFVDNNDQQLFKEVSYQLYLSLSPFLKTNSKTYVDKKLIIIPDNRLHYVPFESFVTTKDQALSASYLINFCDISYAYSYSSLNISYTDEFEKDFFAISPSVFKDRSLSSLTISKSDISNIESTLNTIMVSREKATKELFLKEYGTSKVVHISTHGGILNDKPWISFNDKKLMLNDIYFKNQKANLVVLSACKTSHGELKKGEGVMSIARAFINSGSKSVVSSLWDINQRSTNEIITTFYSNLKEGGTKSEALRNAKITYINNHKNTSEASPFYWSSLVLTGDSSQVFVTYDWLWILIVALVLCTLLIYLGNRLKTKFIKKSS